MDRDTDNRENDQGILNFALVIQQTKMKDSLFFDIKARNQGIHDANVILIIEEWIKRTKARYQNELVGNS